MVGRRCRLPCTNVHLQSGGAFLDGDQQSSSTAPTPGQLDRGKTRCVVAEPVVPLWPLCSPCSLHSSEVLWRCPHAILCSLGTWHQSSLCSPTWDAYQPGRAPTGQTSPLGSTGSLSTSRQLLCDQSALDEPHAPRQDRGPGGDTPPASWAPQLGLRLRHQRVSALLWVTQPPACAAAAPCSTARGSAGGAGRCQPT